MGLFKTEVAQSIWLEKWCDTCFERHEAARRLQGLDTQCPILKRALRQGRKTPPPEWERNPRSKTMDTVFKCTEYKAKPDVARRDSVDEDVPMFDVETTDEVLFVPVEGWPDAPTKRGTDHA